MLVPYTLSHRTPCTPELCIVQLPSQKELHVRLLATLSHPEPAPQEDARGEQKQVEVLCPVPKSRAVGTAPGGAQLL